MAGLKAVLGPTNTGKTHYAIDRMLGHATGMIGLPLRLLAREVYDRVVEARGEGAAALVTGEERIIPPGARYWVCTVESMPVSEPVDFLAVDEIQLAEDPDRGHIFTDRILHARGRSETLLLGAATMAPVLRDLGMRPETDVRERFSDLRYAGPAKVTKLAKRSAIVAFSAEQVYAIAELLRRQKGGAAVVMGALSPRTRNAQVELYQSGEVDYVVATDAIGMGLNLDIDHVAFAGISKWDGRRRRRLGPSELAQIAGRAGRFRSEGSFGETGDCPELDADVVKRIEAHDFEPVGVLEWRNSELDFSSLAGLIASLSQPSGRSALRQNPDALDEWVARRLSEDAGVGPGYAGEAKTRRLWDLCRLPDFRKAGHEGHFNLVRGLVDRIGDPEARLSDAWIEARLDKIDVVDGDIPVLQQRLADIRTWTYAAYRDDWLERPEVWRARARDIEDRLSDALHSALTARFVDRRTTALLASLRKEEALVTDITPAGEISVEGHVVGRLKGLLFEPDSEARTLEGRAVRNAALAAVRPILAKRLADIATALPPAFDLTEDGEIAFDGEVVARIAKGADWLTPTAALVGGDEALPEARERARARIETWLRDEVANALPTHAGLKGDAGSKLDGLARGLAFRVLEAGAAVDLRQDAHSDRLSKEQREALKVAGVRAGRVAAYAPDAQKPASQRVVALLRSAFDRRACPQAPVGAGSFQPNESWSDEALQANGYLRFGPLAIRADLAERLAWELQKRRTEAGANAFAAPPELASIISCPGPEFEKVLRGFGLSPAERDTESGAPTLWRYKARSRPDQSQKRAARSPRKPKAGRTAGPVRPATPVDSPFAALSALVAPETPSAGAPKKRRTRRKSQRSAAPPAKGEGPG
ncbi:MAG: helicase-related protein [Pseudomonadota bacterium]